MFVQATLGRLQPKNTTLKRGCRHKTDTEKSLACSNCTDYQARRLGIKYREKEGAAPKGFVHTLNSTAVATGRTIVALLENNQQADGTINIPVALRKYMGDREKIDRKR